MDPLLLLAIFIVILILLLHRNSENLTDKITLEPISLQKTTPKPFIKLYEEFNENGLVFDFQPVLNARTSNFLRKILRVNLKSMDLNLPIQKDCMDDERRIEIWSVYDSSTVSDFYNSFTEPDFAKKANPAKFKLIANVKAGERLNVNVMDPVKKIYIFARL